VTGSKSDLHDEGPGLSDGFVSLPSLLVPDELVELRRDAITRRAGSEVKEREGWQIIDGWQLLGPARYAHTPAGDVRDAIAVGLVGRLNASVGLDLEPVQSNYLYYDRDDFLGLHHDQERCVYTLIVWLDGPLDETCLHPELRGVTSATIAETWSDAPKCGGLAVRLDDGPLLLHGVSIPHHRRPHRYETPLALATFCFRPVRVLA
jgi:hypothetical protein